MTEPQKSSTMRRFVKLYLWSLVNSYRYIAPGWWDLRFWFKLPYKAAWITYMTIRDENRMRKAGLL